MLFLYIQIIQKWCYCLSKNDTRETGMPIIYLVSPGSEDHDQMMQQRQQDGCSKFLNTQ